MFMQYVKQFLLLAALSPATLGVSAYAQSPTPSETQATAGKIKFVAENSDGREEPVELTYHTDEHLNLSDGFLKDSKLLDQAAGGDGTAEVIAYEGQEQEVAALQEKLKGHFNVRAHYLPKDIQTGVNAGEYSLLPAPPKPRKPFFVAPNDTDVGGGFFLATLQGGLQYSLWLNLTHDSRYAFHVALLMFGVTLVHQVFNETYTNAYRIFQLKNPKSKLARIYNVAIEWVTRVAYDIGVWNGTNAATGMRNSAAQQSVSAFMSTSFSSAFQVHRDRFLTGRRTLKVGYSFLIAMSLLYWKVSDQTGNVKKLFPIEWLHYDVRLPLAVAAGTYVTAIVLNKVFPKTSYKVLKAVTYGFEECIAKPLGRPLNKYLVAPAIGAVKKTISVVFGKSKNICNRIYDGFRIDDTDIDNDVSTDFNPNQ